jgi:hypothetical protein
MREIVLQDTGQGVGDADLITDEAAAGFNELG